jgi:hypothetical protein
MSHLNTSKRISAAALQIDHDARPGWITATERLPTVGEEIFCTEGLAELVRVHGKTGNGSRLLELRLPGVKTPPFFAAASNVLVAPRAA